MTSRFLYRISLILPDGIQRLRSLAIPHAAMPRASRTSGLKIIASIGER